MYSCVLHGWTSYSEMCPICSAAATITTTSTTVNPVESPTTADASVLVEALEYLINDIKRKPNDTRYATAIKKATDALAQYSTRSLPEKEWRNIEDKRYLLIDGNAYYSLVFDQWNDGDFEADNIDGSYRVLISKNETGYSVANAVDGWGNNSKDHFKDSKVILLNPIQSLPESQESKEGEVTFKQLEQTLLENGVTAGKMDEVISALRKRYHITKKP